MTFHKMILQNVNQWKRSFQKWRFKFQQVVQWWFDFTIKENTFCEKSNYFIFFFEKKSDYAILKLFEKYVFLITIPIFDHYNIITQHWWIKRGQSSFPPFCIQFFFKRSRTTEKSFLFFLINLLICKVFM